HDRTSSVRMRACDPMTKTMQGTANPIAIRLTSSTIVNRGARIPSNDDIHRNMALESSCAEDMHGVVEDQESNSFAVSQYLGLFGLSSYLYVCRTIIKFVSHPRQIPYEGCTVCAKRIGVQCMRGRRSQEVGCRICFAGDACVA